MPTTILCGENSQKYKKKKSNKGRSSEADAEEATVRARKRMGTVEEEVIIEIIKATSSAGATENKKMDIEAEATGMETVQNEEIEMDRISQTAETDRNAEAAEETEEIGAIEAIEVKEVKEVKEAIAERGADMEEAEVVITTIETSTTAATTKEARLGHNRQQKQT